jgi:hypothetical protein
MKMLRQGDVLLKPIEKIPTEAKETTDNVLARGEATGHSHRIEGARVFRNGDQLLLQVEQEAQLVHEEHGLIQVPRGDYEVVRQREYNPVMERQVTD